LLAIYCATVGVFMLALTANMHIEAAAVLVIVVVVVVVVVALVVVVVL